MASDEASTSPFSTSDQRLGILDLIRVADTLKRADTVAGVNAHAPRVLATEDRSELWQAQTPQMFRYGRLCEALDRCSSVTDEAGALEALGDAPRLVAGDATNLKVTYPADLPLAALILRSRR